MAVIIGRVSEHAGSNIVVGGKVIFVPPEKRNAATINFPAGSVAKVTVDKGTALSITPPSEQELAAFTRNEMGNQKPPVAGNPVPKAATVQTPPPPPAAQPQAVKEAIVKAPVADTDQKGTIVSVMIGGTINFGNYNNVKMEVTATSAEAARTAFQQEISTTVEMMKGIIKQVGVPL